MELDPSKITSLENKIEVLKNPNNAHALDLIKSFFHYDPAQRMTALKAIKHKYFTETCDFNPNCVWRTPPSNAGLDIKYYPERPLTQVGMHGQSTGPAGAASSAHYNNNAHKRAAPGGKCLCVCVRTRAYVYVVLYSEDGAEC
jgi:hypothetical protein